MKEKLDTVIEKTQFKRKIVAYSTERSFTTMMGIDIKFAGKTSNQRHSSIGGVILQPNLNKACDLLEILEYTRKYGIVY